MCICQDPISQPSPSPVWKNCRPTGMGRPDRLTDHFPILASAFDTLLYSVATLPFSVSFTLSIPLSASPEIPHWISLAEMERCCHFNASTRCLQSQSIYRALLKLELRMHYSVLPHSSPPRLELTIWLSVAVCVGL